MRGKEGNTIFIIYGTKSGNKEIGQVALEHSCPQCGEVMMPLLVRSRRYFTLYWVPIFPFSTKYHLLCSRCGSVAEIPKEVAKSMPLDKQQALI